MKIKTTILLAIFFTAICFSQNTETETPQINTEKATATETQPMPFKLAEFPPLAPDCKEKWKIEKQQNCTRNFILNHVNRKLNTNLVSELGLTGFVRIDVTFTIDKEGNPKNISASGGPEILNQNAIEVLKTLPQLTPATHHGELVEIYLKFPVALDIR